MSDEFDSFDEINRRSYLQATGAAALGTVGLAGCVGRASGTLATSVTDQPADIGDFESLVVTIEGIWLGPQGANSGADDEQTTDDEQTADDEQTDDGGDADGDGAGGNDDADGDDGDGGGSEDGGGEADEDDDPDDADDADDADEPDEDDEDDEDGPSGREYYEFDEPQEADLVQLQGEETQLIDERELSVATYQFLQLDVSDVEGVLDDGSEATVDRPGNAPITFNQEFEIRENTRTSFTADFAPVRRGTGSYLLRPVPRGIEVVYEDSSGDDGNESADGDN
ncbi:DUF4382 domain-containing protein [Halorubrum sp. DTA46]|uniref:DUF4382 domain-containing protein n=1 Tax=Halorubrum sp. DTA46 TaxID=3402162 RepID=UPI003AAD17F2